MAGYFTESNYENAVLQLLNEELGYNYIYGPDVERDYHSPLYEDVLLPSLQRINKSLPMDALTEAIYKLKNFETGTLLQKNMVFMDYLQNGVPVKYYDKGEERSTLVYLVDFKNPASNEFTVANQWTFIENSEKRPDVILFVNGLPLVIVELKSPSREETDASAAYRQLRNYMYEIPSMFIYNAVCVMSDLTTSKAGTITSGEDRFMEWKTTDGSYENTQHASFDTFFVGLFEKTRFLDIVKNFICFNVDGQNTFKILAGYHQYFAVKKAIESTKHATVTDGKTPDPAPGGIVYDPGAVEGGWNEADTDKIVDALNEKVEQGMINISMNTTPIFQNGSSAGNLMIVNESVNNYPQVVEIHRNDTGEVIYKSGAIPVGSKLETAKLSADLDAGTYECTALFYNVDPDSGEYLGCAGAVITVTVLE